MSTPISRATRRTDGAAGAARRARHRRQVRRGGLRGRRRRLPLANVDDRARRSSRFGGSVSPASAAGSPASLSVREAPPFSVGASFAGAARSFSRPLPPPWVCAVAASVFGRALLFRRSLFFPAGVFWRLARLGFAASAAPPLRSIDEDDLARLDLVAGLDVHFLDHALDAGRHFEGGLVGLELEHRLIVA